MIRDVFGEKTKLSGLTDAFGLPIKYGDKVIAIDNQGYKYKSFYVGTTPSGYTDKVLSLGGSQHLTRPYRGVLKYEWTATSKELNLEEISIQALKDNDPGIL